MKAQHRSLVSAATKSPEAENRPHSPSRGFLDLFRRRRRSGCNLPLTDIQIGDVGVGGIPVSTKKKPPATRRRSNSLNSADTSSLLPVSAQNSPESLRATVAKRELGARVLLSSSSHRERRTPMSELLSGSLGSGDGSPTFPRKVGPDEFMEMYRSRGYSLDSAAKESLLKFRMRRKGDTGVPQSPLACEKPLPSKKLAGSVEAKPSSSPHLLPRSLPKHVALSAGTRIRRLSVFSPPPDHSEEGRFKQLGIPSKLRRFSEPQGPKMEALRKLSSAQSKIFQPDNISESMSNFPKLAPNISKMSVPTANFGNCFGSHIPLEPTHFVIWKEGKKIEKILKLPCTEEEYLESVEALVPNENRVFMKFLKSRRCYELMPASAKLVVLDKELKVSHAFDALMFNGIRSAPVWDSEMYEYIGILTVTDFMQILKRHCHSKDELNKVCDQKISEWRELMVEDLKPMVNISSDASLYEAVMRLHRNGIHRLLVSDEHTDEALYILTKRRIVHFVWYFFQIFNLPVPDFMNQSVKELDVGTFSDLASISEGAPLLEVLHLLLERGLSALPVLDADGRVVNVYGRFDVMNLISNESYLDLNRTVEMELKSNRPGFEGLYVCKCSDSLGTVIDRMIRADVHHLVVINNERYLEGVISLSDIVHFLILRQDFDDVPEDFGVDMQF